MEPKHKERVACATCNKLYVCMSSLQKHENMHTHQDVNNKVKIVKKKHFLNVNCADMKVLENHVLTCKYSKLYIIDNTYV